MNTEMGHSVFRFILPFYCKTNKKKAREPFCLSDWKRMPISTRYLTHSVSELFAGGEAAVCKFYSLNDAARKKYSLPGRDRIVNMHSDMRACVGDFELLLSGHQIIWFESGLGFLVMRVQVPETELNEIANINFCLSNVFTNEHDSGEKNNNLVFNYEDQNEKISFSVKNSMIQLILGMSDNKNVELFPSSSRKRLITYHSIITNNDLADEDKTLNCLLNSLHSNVEFNKEIEPLSMLAYGGQKWFFNINSVVTIAKYTEQDSFIPNNHKRNVDFDYFNIFMLALHERELLLKDNYLAVKYRNDAKQLIAMKKHLLTMDILYSFNTVSIEALYQKFYSNLIEIFNLDTLRSDIRNVIGNVESHVNDQKDRKVNVLLTTLSFLAIFSILTDGISFADRIDTGTPFGTMQWSVIVLVVAFFAVALIILKKK